MNKKILTTVIVVCGLTGAVCGYYLQDYTLRTYYEKDKIQTEEPYSLFMKNGVSKEFYQNGQVKQQVPYTFGKRNGLAETFFEDGTIQNKKNYVDNKLSGVTQVYYKGQPIDFTFQNDSLSGTFQYDNLKGVFTDNRGFTLTVHEQSDEADGDKFVIEGVRVCTDEQVLDSFSKIVQSPVFDYQLMENALSCVSVQKLTYTKDEKELFTFKGDIQYPNMNTAATFAFYMPNFVETEAMEPNAVILQLDKETKKAEIQTLRNKNVLSEVEILSEKGFVFYGTPLFDAIKAAQTLFEMSEAHEISSTHQKALAMAYYNRYISPIFKIAMQDISLGDIKTYDLEGRLVSQNTGVFNLIKGYLTDTQSDVYNKIGLAFIRSETKDRRFNLTINTPQSQTQVVTMQLTAAPSFKKEYQNMMEQVLSLVDTSAKDVFTAYLLGDDSLNNSQEYYYNMGQKLALKAVFMLANDLELDDLTLYASNGQKILTLAAKLNIDSSFPLGLLTDSHAIQGQVTLYRDDQAVRIYPIGELIRNPQISAEIMEDLQIQLAETINRFVEELKEMLESGYPNMGIDNRDLVTELSAVDEFNDEYEWVDVGPASDTVDL